MAKKTADKSLWFRHDTASMTDTRMQRILRLFGMKGVGIYWCIVEILYVNNGFVELSEIDDLAFQLRVESEVISKLIMDKNIFESDGKTFWSERVNRELEYQNIISEKARSAANKRWKNNADAYNNDADALPSQFDSNASGMHRQTDRQRYKDIHVRKGENRPLSGDIPDSDKSVFIFLPKKASARSKSDEYSVSLSVLANLKEKYPNKDVEDELHLMKKWLTKNAENQVVDVSSFIDRWLSKEGNKKDSKSKVPTASKVNENFDGRESGDIEF